MIINKKNINIIITIINKKNISIIIMKIYVLIFILIIILITIYFFYTQNIKENFTNQSNNYCGINGMDYTINVGNSNKNKKIVKLPSKNITIYPNPINQQEPEWNDAFSTTVKGDRLIVQRLDSKGGWGQNLVLRGCKPLKDSFIKESINYWENRDRYEHQDQKYDEFIKYDNHTNADFSLVTQDKINQLIQLLKTKKQYTNTIHNFNDTNENREKAKKLLELTNDKIIQIENSIKLDKFKIHDIHMCNSDENTQCYKYQKINSKNSLIIAHLTIHISNDNNSNSTKLKQIYLNYNDNKASSIYYIPRLKPNNKNKFLDKGNTYRFICYFNQLNNKINGISFKVINDSIKIQNLHLKLTNPDNITLLDKYFKINQFIKNTTYHLNLNETINTIYQLSYIDNYKKIMNQLCKTKYNGYYTYTIYIKGKTRKTNKNIRVNYHFDINEMMYKTIQNITGDNITKNKVSGFVYGGYDKYTFIINPFELNNLNFKYFSNRPLIEYQFELYFMYDGKKITLKSENEKYNNTDKIYEYLFKLNPDYQKCGL